MLNISVLRESLESPVFLVDLALRKKAWRELSSVSQMLQRGDLAAGLKEGCAGAVEAAVPGQRAAGEAVPQNEPS